MFCVACGLSLTADARFCGRCGEPVPSTTAALLATPHDRVPVFCAVCGMLLAAGAAHCAQCGAARFAAPRPVVAGHGDYSPYTPLRLAPSIAPAAGATSSRSAAALSYASPGMRIAALLLDYLAVGLAYGVLTLTGTALWIAGLSWVANWYLLPGLYAGFALYAWWGFATGQSLGKRLTGLRVVRAGSGRPPGWAYGLIRIGGFFVCLLTPLMLGFLWSLWDPRRQGLHDKIAGTVVLQSPARRPQ